MSWDIEAFREKIEKEHAFPGRYIFKFIVPIAQQQEVIDLLPKGAISTRKSSGNKYVSITCHAELNDSQDVIEVYMNANRVEGCIAL